MPFITTYPYLVWSLGLIGVFASAYALRPAHRRIALASASLSAPYSLLALVFVPAYWEPVQVFRFAMGPEDLIFSFANGGLIWILAGSYYASSTHLWNRVFLARCARVTALFLIAWLGAWLATGLPTMWAALAVGVGLWCFLLSRDRGGFRISLKGAVLFATGYTLWLAVILHANPEFVKSWTAAGLLGVRLLEVPIEEVLWAIEFGAVWPLLVAYFFDLEPRRAVECEVPPPEERSLGATASPA